MIARSRPDDCVARTGSQHLRRSHGLLRSETRRSAWKEIGMAKKSSKKKGDKKKDKKDKKKKGKKKKK